MAASPKYKAYSPEGEYVAAFKYITDALLFVDALSTKGTTIRLGHQYVVWTEGNEGDAQDSHAKAVLLVLAREEKLLEGTR